MKVMHMLDSLNRGGAETLALDLCRNARADGLDLTFVATGGGDLEDEFRRSGAEFIRLQRRGPIDWKLVKELRRIICERNVGVIHCHQAVEAAHAFLATLGTNVRRVLSLHLCTCDAKNKLALKFLVPRMDAVVAVSRDLKDCLGSDEGFDTSKNFHVIYNGVDAARLQAKSRSLRDELKLTDKDILLGMVGNFYPGTRKDQLTVCKSLVQIFRQAPNVHFAFVGGHLKDASQPLDECVQFCREHNISDRAHFLGKRSDIPSVLNSLDVFVFSSMQEGLPIAVIEAMMMGLPTVVSDIGPLLEVSDNGACAAVFRTKDADDLVQKLLPLVTDQAQRTHLGAQAKEWAMRQFSLPVHISNLKRLYNALM